MKLKNLLLTCALTATSSLSVVAQDDPTNLSPVSKAPAAAAGVPIVTTDMRFARGATMAFGRIADAQTNGASISKRGFCLSESPEPTIDDIVSTKTLSNSGTIYYFEDLKPSTLYYMRAYATNKNGTGYGNVIKFYTIPKGNITYSYNNGGSQAENDRINAAFEQTCDIYDNLTCIKKHYNAGYSAGTPTADCNYTDTPWMNIGANASYQRTGTIMHEMVHGLGVIPYSTQWAKNILRSGNGTGEWLGDRVSAFLDFWDNTTGSRLKGDTQHMWPYGINGAHEDNGTLVLYYANAMISQALGEDGLEHRSATFADPYYAFDYEEGTKYYLKCEDENRGLYDSFLVEEGNALKWRAMTPDEMAENDAAAWYISFTPDNQYYQLRNAKSGNYITYSSGFKTATRSSGPTANDNLHVMKSRIDMTKGTTTQSFTARGYWIIHPTGDWSPKALGASTNGNVNAPTFDLQNSATTQRWLILTEAEARKMESVSLGGMKRSFQDLVNQYKALLDVPHTEAEASTDDTFRSALNTLEVDVESARSPEAIETLEKDMRTAAVSFLGNVTVTDRTKPFDLTMMIVNPDLTDDLAGWTLNKDYTCSNGAAEVYESTFNCYQQLPGMPAGTYQMKAQAFHRPGTNDAVYADYIAGTDQTAAYIYFGRSTNTALVKNVMADRQTAKLHSSDVKLADGTYVPNSMAGAAAYFAKGLYDNSVAYTNANGGGQLIVGVRANKGAAGNYYWCMFDNFRLYFYGGDDTLTGIGEELSVKGEESATWYTLSGLRIKGQPTQNGIYIKNGKKVILK